LCRRGLSVSWRLLWERRSSLASTHHLLHDRIERIASWALYSKEMPLAIIRLRFAVVAHDINNALQICRHGVFRNIPSSCFPSGCHTLLTHYRLFANGTAIIKAGQFTEAMRMNGMATRQILWRLARRKHIFATNRAIVLVLVFEALMRLKDTDGNAHTALIAVTKSFHASNAAKPTLFTVKGLFGH